MPAPKKPRPRTRPVDNSSSLEQHLPPEQSILPEWLTVERIVLCIAVAWFAYSQRDKLSPDAPDANTPAVPIVTKAVAKVFADPSTDAVAAEYAAFYGACADAVSLNNRPVSVGSRDKVLSMISAPAEVRSALGGVVESELKPFVALNADGTGWTSEQLSSLSQTYERLSEACLAACED